MKTQSLLLEAGLAVQIEPSPELTLRETWELGEQTALGRRGKLARHTLLVLLPGLQQRCSGPARNRSKKRPGLQ